MVFGKLGKRNLRVQFINSRYSRIHVRIAKNMAQIIVPDRRRMSRISSVSPNRTSNPQFPIRFTALVSEELT